MANQLSVILERFGIVKFSLLQRQPDPCWHIRFRSPDGRRVVRPTKKTRHKDAAEAASAVIAAEYGIGGNPKGLEDFTVSLLEKREAEKIRRFLTRKGIPDLPGDETETIGQAVQSAEFGASGIPSPAQPPVEEPAGAILPVSDGGDTAAGPCVPVPAPSSAAPIGDLPVERGGPPLQAESRDSTRERQRTASSPLPRPAAAAPSAPRSPSPATERAPVPDWRECEPGEAHISWSAFEPLQPRGPQLVPFPGSAPSLEHQQGAERSTEGAAGPSSDGEPDDPPDVRCDVGRWGEDYAFGCLREELLAKYPGAVSEETTRGFRLCRGGDILAEVIWLNRDGEHGVGHDIEVIAETSRLVVEVKSTRDDARAVFDLSDRQWELAKAQGPSYRITRVYNAGRRRDARAVHVADPYRAWRAGELTIRSLRIVL